MAGRRASRPRGPVTPGTDHLLGTWAAPADQAPDATPSRTQDDDATRAAPPVRRSGATARRSRRVTTAPVPGSDPHPAPEPERHGDGENDARLRGDVPPHWG
ncbi:hypothetical protein ASF23_03825 [Curtobacterium sp. Leaf261]|nr:hypothetical protein ASF23_03825 [Curtobacterium sp. Leaf261]